MKSAVKTFVKKHPVLKKVLKQLLSPALQRSKKQAAQRYMRWFDAHKPTNAELSQQQQDEKSLSYRPLISIVTPTYNTPRQYFIDMVESVRAQTYSNWELVIVDDASPNPEVRTLISEYAQKDTRIKYRFLDRGLHIAGATNEAIKLADGEFVSLFDHDDILEPNALYEIVMALNTDPSLNFIYTDEDKYMDSLGYRADPFFKPDWNQDFLYSVNYITHFSTIRKTILDTVGYEDAAFNGAQDWELFLRVARSVPKETIYHIPKILYSWRVHASSTAQSLDAKPYVIEAQHKALEIDLELQEDRPYELERDSLYPGQWRLYFPHDTQAINYIDATWETTITPDMLKDAVTVLQLNGYKVESDESIQVSAGDVFRWDVGFVIPAVNPEVLAMTAMRTLLTADVFEYLQQEKDTLTGHYYRTIRYSRPDVEGAQLLVVKTDTLREVLSLHGDLLLSEVPEKLHALGYRHLYNPYIKR